MQFIVDTVIGGTLTVSINVRDFDAGTLIDWGDGNTTPVVDMDNDHIYASDGTYTVTVTGAYSNVGLRNQNSLIEIVDWGTNVHIGRGDIYYNCANLAKVPDGAPLVVQDSISGMFRGCTSLTSIDLSGWDVSNVTQMVGLFHGCTQLVTIDLSNWVLTSSLAQMHEMFIYCNSLETIIFDPTAWDTSQVFNFRLLFNNCSALTTPLDLSSWDTSSSNQFNGVFYNCKNVPSININGWHLGANQTDMFDGCDAITTLDLSLCDISNTTELIGVFSNCDSLVDINLSGWDFSNITDFNNLFSYCPALTTVTVTNPMVTPACTSLYWAFKKCESLTNVDTTGWDTSNVTTMEDMFMECISLSTIDVSGFDTSNLEDIYRMFYKCGNLTEGILNDIVNWNILSLTRATSFIDNGFSDIKGLTMAGYDAVLAAWSAQSPVNSLSIDFGSVRYTDTASHDLLTAAGWAIKDDGPFIEPTITAIEYGDQDLGVGSGPLKGKVFEFKVPSDFNYGTPKPATPQFTSSISYNGGEWITPPDLITVNGSKWSFVVAETGTLSLRVTYHTLDYGDYPYDDVVDLAISTPSSIDSIDVVSRFSNNVSTPISATYTIGDGDSLAGFEWNYRLLDRDGSVWGDTWGSAIFDDNTALSTNFIFDGDVRNLDLLEMQLTLTTTNGFVVTRSAYTAVSYVRHAGYFVDMPSIMQKNTIANVGVNVFEEIDIMVSEGWEVNVNGNGWVTDGFADANARITTYTPPLDEIGTVQFRYHMTSTNYTEYIYHALNIQDDLDIYMKVGGVQETPIDVKYMDNDVLNDAQEVWIKEGGVYVKRWSRT